MAFLALEFIPARSPQEKENAAEAGRSEDFLSMSFEAIPTLDDLMRDPMTASSLPAHTVESLLGKTAIVQSILISRLLALRVAPHDNTPSESENPDRLLTVEEAARMIGKSESHLYHQAANYPFTVRVGGNLRFSRTGIEKFIRQRRGR